MTIHAWFSQEDALTRGSWVYRKPGGSTVNVTRISNARHPAGRHRLNERYVGEVLSRTDDDDDAGGTGGRTHVPGITG